MDLQALQTALKAQKLYDGPIDGDDGDKTRKAVDTLLEREKITGWKSWPASRRQLAAKQVIVRLKALDVGEIDGLLGPSTLQGFSEYAGKKVTRQEIEAQNAADVPAVQPPARPANIWPRQSAVNRFYGSIGKNQVFIKPSWPMVLSYDTGTPVIRISLHEKVADSAKRVMDRIAGAYTDGQIKELGLDKFGGSLNPRKMRGGTAWSMHSWGIAIDFDPDRNQLKWGRDKARLAKPDAQLFWELWEEEGWVSLGRLRNYDWMHVQAANL